MVAEDTAQPEIHALIERRDFATLKGMVREMEVHDLSALLAGLEDEDLALVFRLLPRDRAADVLAELEPARREELLSTLSSEKVAAILGDMAADDRTELLEELPGEIAQKLLTGLRGEQLQIARRLLAYPEDSIGRLMTPAYVAVRPGWTLARVLEHIREVGPRKETVNVLYVVDDHWQLVDELRLEDVILADPDLTVADLMDDQFACLMAYDDQEEAIELFKKYDAVALPVVNSQGVLVGIVTFDDVMDVVEEEDTEDFQMVTGMAALESSYFTTGFWRMLAKRLPWLAMLLCAQMLTTLALTQFNALPLFAVLVIFMPLINSPAGNTGSQTAGLMIRGLAVQEVAVEDWTRVLRRELLRGVALGVTLAAIGYAAAFVFAPLAESAETPLSAGQLPHIALAVATAIALAVTLANLIGSMLPFFFKRVGLDPAVTSGPFIASLMDFAGIVIYFTIATALLASLAG